MNRREEWQLIYKLTPEQQSQGFRIGGLSCPTLFDKNSICVSSKNLTNTSNYLENKPK